MFNSKSKQVVKSLHDYVSSKEGTKKIFGLATLPPMMKELIGSVSNPPQFGFFRRRASLSTPHVERRDPQRSKPGKFSHDAFYPLTIGGS